MLRVETVTEYRKIDNMTTFFTRFPQYAHRIARAEFAEPPTLLSQLRVEAPARTGKWGGWSTDRTKNRRAARRYFAMIRSGEIKTDGSHYIRTHKLRDGYEVTLFIRGTETLIEVKNTADRKRHLYTKGRRQVPGHVRTGWQRDDPIVRAYMVAFRRRYAEALTTGMRSLTSLR